MSAEKTLKLVIITKFLLAALNFLFAAIWYVHPDSTLNSIQTGLNFCSSHDTVLVAAGTYYENIVWPNTQSIDLMSESGVESTIIDGGGASTNQSVITITTGVGSTTIINGFTIQNGFCEDNGGGIVCSGSSPTIKGNKITQNYSWSGSGIKCNSSSPIIINNIIAGNSAYDGGGIGCYSSSSPYISGNVISGNSVMVDGGGIMCSGGSAIIADNFISGNGAYSENGGGICVYSCSTLITNCTITGNTACRGGGICCFTSAAIITGNTISYNIAYESNYGGGGRAGVFLFLMVAPRYRIMPFLIIRLTRAERVSIAAGLHQLLTAAEYQITVVMVYFVHHIGWETQQTL